MIKEWEIILQTACCNSGEERFCNLCPLRNTKDCIEAKISNDDLYDAIKSLLGK